MNGDLTQYSMSNAPAADIRSNFSRMKFNETVLSARNQCQTIEKILAVICGVHHLQVIRETFAPNLKDRKIGFTGAINSCRRASHQPICITNRWCRRGRIQPKNASAGVQSGR